MTTLTSFPGGRPGRRAWAPKPSTFPAPCSLVGREGRSSRPTLGASTSRTCTDRPATSLLPTCCSHRSRPGRAAISDGVGR